MGLTLHVRKLSGDEKRLRRKEGERRLQYIPRLSPSVKDRLPFFLDCRNFSLESSILSCKPTSLLRKQKFLP